jgi:restriction system protein
MKLKMAQNSLFAILLRSPWWISIAIAALIVVIARAALRDQFVLYGVFAAAPFIVIGIIAAWKQLRAPSAARVADTLQTVRSMSWREFSNTMENTFRDNGYEVTRLDGREADFAIIKAGRTALVSCKRWKAASNGVEPLRDLHAAMDARGAQESIFVTTGEISDNARRFAVEQKIRVILGAELAQLLHKAGRATKESS